MLNLPKSPISKALAIIAIMLFSFALIIWALSAIFFLMNLVDGVDVCVFAIINTKCSITMMGAIAMYIVAKN